MSKQHQFEIVHAALHWLAENKTEQPELSALARRMGYSPSYIQRVFLEWAGLSPKQFLKLLTREAAVARLVAGNSTLETSHSIGLSSTGRLYDLLVTTDAMTPGEIKNRAKNVTLSYGYAFSPFGDTLVAWTARGISFLAFCHETGRQFALSSLQLQWPDALLVESGEKASTLIDQIFDRTGQQPMKIWLRGSPFQLKVWQALLAIPEGAHATYSQIAASMGSEGASRAVGTAIGSNPVSWIIPCHRVIRKMGDLGGYRWGSTLKTALIGRECSAISSSTGIGDHPSFSKAS